jgi:hypothetical protein
VSAVAWIVVVAGLWLVVSVPLSLLLGKVVRMRDKQAPTVAVSPCPEAHDR